MSSEVCSSCAAVRKPDSRFCFNCGARFDEVRALAQVPVAAAPAPAPPPMMANSTPVVAPIVVPAYAEQPRTFLPSIPDEHPDVGHSIAGAAVGVVLGSVAWIMLVDVLVDFGFARYFRGLIAVSVAALGLGVIVGAMTMIFGGGRDLTTTWVAGAGALLVGFTSELLWLQVRSAPLGFVLREFSSWRPWVATVLAIGAAVMVTLIRPPIRPWESSPS